MFLERQILNRIRHSIENNQKLTNKDIDNFHRLIQRYLCKSYIAMTTAKSLEIKVKLKSIIQNVTNQLYMLNDLKCPLLKTGIYFLNRHREHECWLIGFFLNTNVKIKTFRQYYHLTIALFLNWLGKIKSYLNKARIFIPFVFFENKLFETIKKNT